MELRVLDERLDTVWRIPLPSSWVAWHGIADDLSLAALALHDTVRLVDRRGKTVASFSNPSAPSYDDQTGGCVFTADGRHVWAIMPTVRGDRLVDELWLIDLGDLSVVDRRLLETGSSWCRLYRHPDGQAIAISSGYAEKCDPIIWARPDGHGLVTWRAKSRGWALRGVHHDGVEHLTVSESSYEYDVSELARHELATGMATDRLQAGSVTASGTLDSCTETHQRFEEAGYLTAELVLAELDCGQVLVRRQPLEPLGWVCYPDDEPRWLYPPATGTWVTGSASPWTIERWVLPEIPRLEPFGEQLTLTDEGEPAGPRTRLVRPTVPPDPCRPTCWPTRS
jgi:hypothetical protein